MLRSALTSILLAFFILVSCFAFLSRDGGSASTASERWGDADMRIVAGARLNSAESNAVTMDAEGRVIIEIDGGAVDLSDLPLLHLKFKQRPDVLAMVIAWRPAGGDGRIRSRRVGLSPDRSFWMDMSPRQDWAGRASTLALIFLGPGGGSVDLESIELLPAVFPNTLFSQLADWRTFQQWQHSAVNSHLGTVIPGASPHPAVVMALTSAVAILVYLVGVWMFRNRSRFQWRVLGLLFFFCWFLLDAVWQNTLYRQIDRTHETFAGKSQREKRLADLDGALYQFIDQVDKAIVDDNARVFVNSSDDYTGMRGAYYLYPHNVYWKRFANSLPAPELLHSGDYVLLLAPALARFDVDSGSLLYGDGMQLLARPVMSSGIGALYKVM